MKNMKRRILAMILTVVMVLGMVPTGALAADGEEETTVVPVESIVLDKSEVTLEVGGTETLTATVSPEDATDKTVTWTCDNEEVATVADGVVTAVAAGEATITAKAGEKTATCAVTVNVPVVEVEGIALDKSEVTLEVGGTETLTATVSPDNATDKAVTWTSDNEAVATVTDGVVTAVAAGTTTITAKAGEKTATCAVTVNAPAVNPNEIDTTLGGTVTLPSNIAYIDKFIVGDTVSVKEGSFDSDTKTIDVVLAAGTAADATFDITFSTQSSLPSKFSVTFSGDVNEDGTGTVTLEDGSAVAYVTVTLNANGNALPGGTWTVNFSTAVDTTNNEIDTTLGGTVTLPSNIAYIDKFIVGDMVSVKEGSFDSDTKTIDVVLAAGTAADATFGITFSTQSSMPSKFSVTFSGDVNEDGTGTVTLEDGSAVAYVTVTLNANGNQLPGGTWTVNFSTAVDTTNNVVDTTLDGTVTLPSNIAYIDKFIVGDTVSVKEGSFDSDTKTIDVVLAAGTAADATFDIAFSTQSSMPSKFSVSFGGDVNEDGTGTVTLEDGSAVAYVTVTLNANGNQLPGGTWTVNFTTASGSSSGGNKNQIPVEYRGVIYEGFEIGIQVFVFEDCKVLDYNWAEENILNVYVSDVTANDGTLVVKYFLSIEGILEVSIPSPYTVQLENGRATLQYDLTPVGAYTTGGHSLTVNITNKGLTRPALAEGVSAEVNETVSLGEAYTVDLSKVFTDAEDDPMTYTVSIDGEPAISADENYSFTVDVPSDYVLVFKAHDGMNESEVTYTVNLSVPADTNTYPITVKVSEDITPSFYITKKFLDDGTDQPGNALTAAKGETADGWTTYTVNVPANVSRISVRGADAAGTNWGGMALEVQENGTYYLRSVQGIINSKVSMEDETFYPTEEQAVFKVEYVMADAMRYAVSGGSFNDEYGYLGYRFLLVAADNDLIYTYYAEPLGDLAKYYSTNAGDTKTVTTDSAETLVTTLPIATKSSFTITAPTEAKVQMFSQTAGNYYGGYEVPAYETVDNEDGTKSVTFNFTDSCPHSFRVSMEGKITKAGYVSDDNITVTWDENDLAPDSRREYDMVEDGVYEYDESWYYVRADDSMVVNGNYRQNLLLDVGETYLLRSYRIWQIINNDTQNVMIEPDFHLNVISGEDVISVAVNENYHRNGTGNYMDITALKEGTAIIEVTYDAIALQERTTGDGEINGMGGLTFNACDPTRTALIVVQVGVEESDINFGILNNGGNVWDADYDTLYFLEEQGQITFNPTVETGIIKEVAVSGDKGENWTVLTGNDGAYTADIVPGNNIIRITKGDGTVSYQIVRGSQITYTVTERLTYRGEVVSDGDGIIEAGEMATICIFGGHVPFGKMAGLQNPWSFYTIYTCGDTQPNSGTQMYGYAHSNEIFLPIPEDAQPGDVLTLTNGYTEIGTGFGGVGGYREAGDVVPPNLNAPDNVSGAFNIFPDLTVTVGQDAEIEETVHVESVELDKTTAEIEAGKTLTLTATVSPAGATDKTVTWTSSDESVATVVNGVVTAVAEGTATITVTTTDGGKTASCTVTVIKAQESEDTELDFGLSEDEVIGYVTISFEDNGIRVEGEEINALYKNPLGTIIEPVQVPFKAYDTIASVTLRLLEAKGITASYSGSEYSGFYLSAIGKFKVGSTAYDSFGEFDAGQGSGWMITWNKGGTGEDWFINKGASEFYVTDGDIIKWQYTCQLGVDIGDTESVEAIENVEKLIDEIGTVTEDSGDAITAAREAYEALNSDFLKKQVENYDVLEAAEEAYAKLVATGEDKEAAAAVEEMIKAIGEVTLEDEEAIKEAREAYEALTDTQKLLVDEAVLAELEAAEKTLEALKKPVFSAEDVETIYKNTGDYLEELAEEYGIIVGSIGGEWIVIGLERAGRDIPDADAYYEAVVKYVNENINDAEQLHRAKSTENSRIILALTALGYDVTNVDGHNLLEGLTSMTYLKKQGINGPIWALIAFDSHDYEIPEGGDVTREALIDYILSVQLEDGGWTLSGNSSDADMTGMALQTLAPYYSTNDKVKAAVDKALDCLSGMQYADGSFGSVDGSSSESCAQVIVALTALGINPDTDARFIKNGISVLDALCGFYVQGGGFEHISDGGLDGMATEQGYYALVSYFRMLNDQTSLYDMSDVEINPSVKEYQIISGADSNWKKSSGGKVVIICNGEFADFTGIKVDGKLVDASLYKVEAGSTIVTLESAYLETLTVGTHTVTFTYVDGEVSTGLTILAASGTDTTAEPDDGSQGGTTGGNSGNESGDAPDTGDDFNGLLWMSLAFCAMAAAGVVLVEKKKRGVH